MSEDYPWMIYGATGYSGELIARKAVAQGLRPILAARDGKAVSKIAEALDLSWRSFEISDWKNFRCEISRVNLLVNAAGPLMQSSVLVAESCLAAHTHYFDLNNHIPSLVATYTLDAEAKAKNLTLLPGLALSPAASNCLVQHLHTLLPDADSVDIALEPFMRTHSPGANLTITENIMQGGLRRRGGVLERCRFDSGLIEVQLPTGSRRMLPGALGDIEATFRSTKLPNITTYIVADLWSIPGGFRRTAPADSVRSSAQEPNTKQFQCADGTRQSLVWARLSKLGQSSLEGWLEFGEWHELTAAVVIAGVSRLLNDKRLSAGAHTPATALGPDFILDLPNLKRTVQPLTQGNVVLARD
ncbi:MAG TPA: hypothetical protein VI636_10875 [Candidatus Angelobacter sp.]